MSDANGTCEYVLDPDDPETWGGEEGDNCYVDSDELNQDNLWSCPRNVENGDDFCIFHKPIDKKDSEDIQNAFLNTVKSDGRGKHIFIGSKFGDLNISRDKFLILQNENNIENETKIGSTNSPIIMKHCDFYNLDFSSIIVKSKVVISGSEFKSYVNFTGAKLSKGVELRGTTVEGGIDFTFTESSGPIDIRNCNVKAVDSSWGKGLLGVILHPSISLFESYIDDSVGIFNSTISGKGLNMHHSIIKDKVGLTELSVKSSIKINGSSVGNNINLSSTTIETKLDISGLTSDGGIYSNRPNIKGGINASDCEIEYFRVENGNICGDVEFRNSTIKKSLEISQTEFEAGLKFPKITIGGTANFDQSSIAGDVLFLKGEIADELQLDSSNISRDTHLNFSELKVGRGASLNNLDLSDSNISNADLNMSDFSKSNLSNANLSYSSLKGSTFERAIFNRADLFGTDFSGVSFYGAIFGDAQINEDTEFGDRCVYDPEFNDEPDADIDTDKTGRLTKAAGQYRIIEQLARTNAFPDMVSHNFIRRQDIHREQHRQEGRWGRWLRATASKYVLEYGENPWRLIATGLIIVVGFGLLYPLVGGLQPNGGSTITLSRTIDNPVLLLQSIYYSTLTFTTLGMGDFLPVGLGRVLTTLETSLGAIIIALLVFVFGRRAAR